MQFSEHDLRAAVTAGALDTNALSRLLDFLATRQSSVPSVAAAPAPQFDLAHLLWYAGAARVRGSEAALFTALAPVTAVLLAAGLLGEPLGAAQLGGMACVLGAALLLGRTRSP